MRNRRDQFRGALLGAAIGDALGNPVEGFSAERIRRVYGYVRDYVPNWDPPGTVTDDSEQMMFVARSLVEKKNLILMILRASMWRGFQPRTRLEWQVRARG